MPDQYGNFKGQGWSRAKAEAWDRVFGPKQHTRHYEFTSDEFTHLVDRTEELRIEVRLPRANRDTATRNG